MRKYFLFSYFVFFFKYKHNELLSQGHLWYIFKSTEIGGTQQFHLSEAHTFITKWLDTDLQTAFSCLF